MGEMTLGEFREDVRYQAGGRTDLTSARLGRWVNRALRWVANPQVYRHPELKLNASITLVDGTSRYALPADFRALRFVTNETQLFKYDPQQMVDYVDGDGLGQRTYARDGTDLLISANSANAGEVVRVFYWAKPDTLVADGDQTELDEFFDEPLLARATALAHAAIGDLAAADYFNAAAADVLNEFIRLEQLEGEDTGWRNELIRQGGPTMQRSR